MNKILIFLLLLFAVSVNAQIITVGGFSNFSGATATTNGAKGLVPAPLTGQEEGFLKGDGTWSGLPESWGISGNTATAAKILGSTDNTDVNIQSGTANLNVGATATPQNINIGTGAAAKTVTLGNQTSTTGLLFNSGTSGETHISTAAVGAAHFFSAPNLANGSALQAFSASTNKIANSTALDARVQGALTTPSITTFGANIQNTHTGTTLTNVGLSVSASGATNNYGLLVPSGLVGVGTSTPVTPLEVRGNSVFATQAATATLGNTTASSPVFLRFAGNANFLMGVNGSTANGTVAAGHGFIGSPGLNSFHIATALASVGITGIYLDGISNNVGINNIAPTQKLHVTGNILASGTITPSDKRLKSNIQALEYGLQDLVKLRPVSYTKRHSLESKETNNEFGFIAQELQKVMPELVIVGTDKDKLLSVNYTSLIPVLVKAMQEQQKTIQDLGDRLKNLENK